MAQCIAATADGTRRRMHGHNKFEGTAAEGLCGRHHHLLIATDAPVMDAASGLTIPKPERGSS